MAYKQISPQSVVEGGTGASTLTGVLTGNGTSAVSASTITQYGTVIADASNAVTSVAPSATTGVPLVSQGSSANPAYSTAVVAGGGTGVTSTTAYGVICGGTTTTAALQNAGAGSSGQVLTSQGSSALPTWTTSTTGSFSTVVQVFTGNGTYTPTSGMEYCIIECVGGGGAGGGAAATSAIQNSVGGGGGGGEYTRGVFDSATIGASQAVTVGAGGTGVSGSAGNNGNTTSVGSTIISAAGGTGGNTSGTTTTTIGAASVAGGTGGAGADFAVPGSRGSQGIASLGVWIWSGEGGGTVLGGRTTGTLLTSGGTGVGTAGVSYGGGGGGAGNGISQGAATGASGADGIVVITEFVFS